MSSNILQKAWYIVSIIFALALAYLLINDWSYNTIFLPFLEGYLTIAGLLAYGYIHSALKATKERVYSLTPWIIVFVFILTGIVFAVFGGDTLIRSTAMLAGGLGIPLGVFIQVIHSLLNTLPIFVQTLILIAPTATLLLHSVTTAIYKQYVSSSSHFLTNFVMPLMLLIISAMAISFYLGTQELVKNEDDTSYQQGRELQEVIEGYFREKGYFPESLSSLVEEKYLSEIPVSVVDGTQFKYEADTGLQNYTVCFPRHEEEICERSWSR